MGCHGRHARGSYTTLHSGMQSPFRPGIPGLARHVRFCIPGTVSPPSRLSILCRSRRPGTARERVPFPRVSPARFSGVFSRRHEKGRSGPAAAASFYLILAHFLSGQVSIEHYFKFSEQIMISWSCLWYRPADRRCLAQPIPQRADRHCCPALVADSSPPRQRLAGRLPIVLRGSSTTPRSRRRHCRWRR